MAQKEEEKGDSGTRLHLLYPSGAWCKYDPWLSLVVLSPVAVGVRFAGSAAGCLYHYSHSQVRRGGRYRGSFAAYRWLNSISGSVPQVPGARHTFLCNKRKTPRERIHHVCQDERVGRVVVPPDRHLLSIIVKDGTLVAICITVVRG